MVLLLLLTLSLGYLTQGPKVNSVFPSDGSIHGAYNDKFFQFYTDGYTIPTGDENYIELDIEGILHWDGIKVDVVGNSGVPLTNYTITWLNPFDSSDPEDSLASSNVQTVDFNSIVTTLESMRARIKIENPSANADAVVSINIKAWDD